MQLLPLKSLSLEALDAWLGELGEPPFRVRQIKSWIYGKGALGFAEMTDLPLSLRNSLSERARLVSAEPVLATKSRADGAVKQLFRLADGQSVEAVIMPGEKRTTLCVSSQVGCPLDCIFCETGRWGFARNLGQDEILDQIIQLRALIPAGSPTPNIVFMGMGEPLLNYEALLGALTVMNRPDGLGLGGRRITVSTSGLPRRIRDLAAEPVKTGLALSLNAADDALRRALMPALAKYPIAELLDACEHFALKTQRRVTLEYVLFAGVNDREEDVLRLSRLARGRPFKVNLIPYNPGDAVIDILPPGEFERRELRRPTPGEVHRFAGRLAPELPALTVRWSQGVDVGGGCGQLRGRALSGS